MQHRLPRYRRVALRDRVEVDTERAEVRRSRTGFRDAACLDLTKIDVRLIARGVVFDVHGRRLSRLWRHSGTLAQPTLATLPSCSGWSNRPMALRYPSGSITDLAVIMRLLASIAAETVRDLVADNEGPYHIRRSG